MRHYDPSWWFEPELFDRAVEVCGRCAMRTRCLAQALRSGERLGVWGGLTPEQRAGLPDAVVIPLPGRSGGGREHVQPVWLLAAALIAVVCRAVWSESTRPAPAAVARSTPATPRGRPGAGHRASAPVPGRHDVRRHDVAPFGVGRAGHRHVRHPRVAPDRPLHGFRPHVLASADDQVAAAAVDAEASVREPPAEIAGRQPAVWPRIDVGVGSAIGAQQHRAADVDLAVVGDADLDAVEGHAVVDDPAAGLGHPVGGHDVGWQGRRGRRTAEHDDTEAGRVDPAERCGYEADERRRRGSHPPGRSGGAPSAGAGRQCPRDDGEAADVGEREAGQPVVVARDGQPGARRPRRGGDGVMGEYDALGVAGRAARRHRPGRRRPRSGGRPSAGARSRRRRAPRRRRGRRAEPPWPVRGVVDRAGRRRRRGPTAAEGVDETPARRAGRGRRGRPVTPRVPSPCGCGLRTVPHGAHHAGPCGAIGHDGGAR